MSWFVVRAKPHQEFRAEDNLRNQGFETYIPTIQFKNKKLEALFSGYLFLENKPSREPFIKIRSTRGVLCLVRFGLNLALAEDSLIQTLKQQEIQFKNLEPFSVNDQVRVKNGPFADFKGIYLCKSGEERAIILLRWLNRDNQIEVSENQLEKA